MKLTWSDWLQLNSCLCRSTASWQLNFQLRTPVQDRRCSIMSSNCFRAKLFSPPSWPAMHVQNVDTTWVSTLVRIDAHRPTGESQLICTHSPKRLPLDGAFKSHHSKLHADLVCDRSSLLHSLCVSSCPLQIVSYCLPA